MKVGDLVRDRCGSQFGIVIDPSKSERVVRVYFCDPTNKWCDGKPWVNVVDLEVLN